MKRIYATVSKMRSAQKLALLCRAPSSHSPSRRLQAQMRNVESQDAVQNAVPSGDVRKQEIRFSCP